MFDFKLICLAALAAQVSAFPTLDHMKQIVGGEVDTGTLAEIAKLQVELDSREVAGRAAFDAPIESMMI